MASLEMRPEHDETIRANARETYPHECCGFLLGLDQDGVRRVERIVPAVNERGELERHNRFTISPRAFLYAEKEARGDGLEVLGFYHSHPDAAARPSAYDLEHAWPVYSYVIVSVRERRPAELTCWILKDDRCGFDEQPVSIHAR